MSTQVNEAKLVAFVETLSGDTFKVNLSDHGLAPLFQLKSTIAKRFSISMIAVNLLDIEAGVSNANQLPVISTDVHLLHTVRMQRSLLLKVALPVPGFKSLSASTHSIALLNSGQPLAFGVGANGQLGNRSHCPSDAPTIISIGDIIREAGQSFTKIKAVAAGGNFSVLVSGRNTRRETRRDRRAEREKESGPNQFSVGHKMHKTHKTHTHTLTL
jgi:hypothetical protein